MKTIERQDRTVDNSVANPPNKSRVNPESTDSLSADLDLLNSPPSLLVLPETERQPRKKSLHYYIRLIILPWMLIPAMIGGSLLVGKFNQTLNPKPDPAIAQPQANDDRWTNLLLLLCLGGINSGAALWLLTRRLSNSLGEIGHRLEEAAQGNLETYLDVKSTAELQQVAEHFNQLVANCNHTIKQQRITADGNRLFGKIALAAREYLDPIEVYNLGVIGIKQILQVDRVLVYRFEADWSGTIIAEAVAPEYKSALFERVTDTYFTESPAGVEHYRQGGKLVVNDVAQASLTPCHQDIYVDLQVRATVVVPIVVKEKLVGLLCVQQCSKSRQWDGGEVDFCLQAAQRVGLAVEQIEMWEEQSNTLRRAQMLSHTLQLQHSEEFGEVMTEILHDIRQEFNLDRAIILSINEQWEGEIIAEVLKTGNPSMLGQEIDAHPDIEAFRSGGYERGQVTVIEDIYRGDLNHHQIELMEALQVRARILAPILVEDQLFGLLIGHMCNHPRPWEPGEIDRFASVAQQTGVALDRSKMIERREANLQRAKLLSDVSLKLRQSFKETEILDNALPEIRQAFGLDRAIVLAFDQTWQGKIIAEATAIPELSIGGEVITESWFQSSQGAGFDRGKTIAMADVAQANLSECHRQLLERLQVRANIVVPILTGNKLFGLLIGHMCHDPRRWQTTEIDLLAQIATQIGLALNQAQLLAQREADARRASILSNFTLQLRQSLDRDRILNTAVELVRQSLDLDRAIVFGLDRDFNGKIIAESVISDRLSILEEEIYDTCIQDAGYQQGRTNAIPDVYQAGLTDCHLKMLERLQVRANLIVPITIDSQLFGLLIGHQCHQPRSWQPEEISLLNQLATQLALALNQSQLVEQLAIASQQQAELAAQQQAAKEALQKHAWDLLMQVDLISKGDLTIRARVTDDEIGTIADSYNATVESLSQLVTEVQTVSHQVVNTTYENGQSVADLSTEALQQVEEVRAAHQRLQEMSQSIQMVVHHALAAESAILEAAQIVEAGDVAMNRTVEGMLSIRHTVAETAKKVKRLGESSQKISRVVNLIGSFAAQTNLLALNASIEAARAGEEGRGFAVVAEEVRALARQSAEATGEIEKLVASIQMETNEVVTAMEVGTEQVVAGTKLVDETRSRLNQITATSNRIAELVQTIAEAALAQSEQSAQVTHSIERVSLISTTTSERADRVRSSFQELLELSQELQTHIGQFKIG